jgi:hypothetical protein
MLSRTGAGSTRIRICRQKKWKSARVNQRLLNWETTMKILFALLLFSSMAFAGQPASKEKEKKPAAIQDGSAAKSYIHKALYEYLEKPPYLAVELATPFLAKQVAGKNVWLSLVEFSCGTDHMNCVVCATVIIYDPATKQHRFMNPDDFTSTVKKEPTNKEPTDKESTDKAKVDGDAI